MTHCTKIWGKVKQYHSKWLTDTDRHTKTGWVVAPRRTEKLEDDRVLEGLNHQGGQDTEWFTLWEAAVNLELVKQLEGQKSLYGFNQVTLQHVCLPALSPEEEATRWCFDCSAWMSWSRLVALLKLEVILFTVETLQRAEPVSASLGWLNPCKHS